MSLFKYSFFFKLHYETTFSYVICITGNIKALGSWDPLKALRLDWSEVIKIFKIFFIKIYFFSNPSTVVSPMDQKTRSPS